MEIIAKARQIISDELGFNDVKTLMRHLKTKGIVLPKRSLLLPQHQKLIYEALFYPEKVKKEWYDKY